MVRPPLNCRCMYVGADASIGPQALRQMLFCQVYTINNVTMSKIKRFSTRKKSYKNTGIILEKRLTLRLWYGKV